jgi:glycosyltransferase involved in cell wall biosynthesis
MKGMKGSMNICALIPAFNEAPYIAAIVEQTAKHIETVVVIDDGSTDDTAAIARAAGAVCLSLPVNRGKSWALRTGIDFARANGFTHVITLDGDGQHLPQDIPAMVRVAEETDADLVIGTRPFARDLMPSSRYYSNTIGSRLASLLIGCEVKDSQSGFRLFRTDKFSTIKLRSQRYEIEMEVLIKMVRSGCSIAHSPIHMVYFNDEAHTKLRPIRDTTRTCLWSLAYRFLGA